MTTQRSKPDLERLDADRERIDVSPILRPVPPPPMAPCASDPARNGRPRVLTDEKKEQVLAFVTAGGSVAAAARYIGVAHTTVGREATRDREFGTRLRRARAKNYMHHITTISRAGTRDWRASAYLLERQWPEEFSRNREVIKIAQTDTVGNDVQFDTPEQARAYYNEMLAVLRERARANGESQGDGEGSGRADTTEAASAGKGGFDGRGH